jgi:hypothetical protein
MKGGDPWLKQHKSVSRLRNCLNSLSKALRLELGFVAGAFPLSPNEAMPGGAVIVQNIGIQKASPPAAGQIPVPFVDAAKVNPKSGAK